MRTKIKLLLSIPGILWGCFREGTLRQALAIGLAYTNRQKTCLQIITGGWCCQAWSKVALEFRCRWMLAIGIALGQKLHAKMERLEADILLSQMPQNQLFTVPGGNVPAFESNSALPSAERRERPNLARQPISPLQKP